MQTGLLVPKGIWIPVLEQNMEAYIERYAYRAYLHPVDAINLPDDEVVPSREKDTRLPAIDRQCRTGGNILRIVSE